MRMGFCILLIIINKFQRKKNLAVNTLKDTNQLSRKILYKYRSLSLNNNWVERIFSHNELYFSTPIGFNDPFDCMVELSKEGSFEDIDKYTNKLIKNYRLSNYSGTHPHLDLKKIDIREIQSQIMKSIGVYSLSTARDNILMWSHYADCHRGICIGFFAGPEDYFFRRSQEIKYRDEYPKTSLFDDDMKKMESSILTKSIHWEYEREFRVIDYQTGPGIKVFDPNLLAEVILGCQISDPDKLLITQWLENHPAKPTLYQATQASRSFSLEIQKCKC